MVMAKYSEDESRKGEATESSILAEENFIREKGAQNISRR